MVEYENFLLDHLDIEHTRSQRAPQSQPDRQVHFCAARGGDVTQIDDMLPTKPGGEQIRDLGFGFGIITADKNVMVPISELPRIHH
jgi:hypothetical protein